MPTAGVRTHPGDQTQASLTVSMLYAPELLVPSRDCNCACHLRNWQRALAFAGTMPFGAAHSPARSLFMCICTCVNALGRVRLPRTCATLSSHLKVRLPRTPLLPPALAPLAHAWWHHSAICTRGVYITSLPYAGLKCLITYHTVMTFALFLPRPSVRGGSVSLQRRRMGTGPKPAPMPLSRGHA